MIAHIIKEIKMQIRQRQNPEEQKEPLLQAPPNDEKTQKKISRVDVSAAEADVRITEAAIEYGSYAIEKGVAGIRYVGNLVGKNLKEINPLFLRPLTQTFTGFFTKDKGQWLGLNWQPLTDLTATAAAPLVVAAEFIVPIGPKGLALPILPALVRAYYMGLKPLYNGLRSLCNMNSANNTTELPDDKSSLLEKISNNETLIAFSGTILATYGIFLGLNLMVRLLGEQSSEIDIINPAAVFENLQKIDPTFKNISLEFFSALYTSTMGFILGRKAVSSAFEWHKIKLNKVENDYFLRQQKIFESLVNNPEELANAQAAFMAAQKNGTNYHPVDVASRYFMETLFELLSSILKASRKSLKELTRVQEFLIQDGILQVSGASYLRQKLGIKTDSCFSKLHGCFAWSKEQHSDAKETFPNPSAPSEDKTSNPDGLGFHPVNISSDQKPLPTYENLSERRIDDSKNKTFTQRARGFFSKPDNLHNQFTNDIIRFSNDLSLNFPLLSKDFIEKLADKTLLESESFQSIFQLNCTKQDSPLTQILIHKSVEGFKPGEESYQQYQKLKYQIFVESIEQAIALTNAPSSTNTPSL
jgi:hypothetical protein